MMSCDFQDDEFTMFIYIYVYESGGQQQNHSIKVSKILRDFIYHLIQHQLLNSFVVPHRGNHARSLLDGVQVVLYISTMVPQDIACAP